MSIKKTLTVLALVSALSGAGSAFAATVAGGTWHYGVGYTGTYGYSNYHHATRSHTASVSNSVTGITSSQRAGAGSWAKASITKIPPTGLSYYYGF